MYIASYDRHGVLRWAHRAGATGQTGWWTRVAVDTIGNSCITGLFDGAATFGERTGVQTTLMSVGNDDVFVATYDRHGVLRWAHSAGGSGIHRGNAVGL